MMSFINFRTAILCCACCLCTVSVNAQEIVVDLGFGPTFGPVIDSTGDLINADTVSYTHLTLPTKRIV